MFGEFETAKALKGLMDKTLIDISFELEDDKKITAEFSIKGVTTNIVFYGVFTFLLLFLLFSSRNIVSNFTISNDKKAEFNEAQMRIEKRNIKSGLSTFYLLNGSYPERLDELVEGDYVDEIIDYGDDEFEYDPSAKDYDLYKR